MNKATLEINGKKITLELTDEQIKQLTGANEPRFKPKKGEGYWFITTYGSISSLNWIGDEDDNFAYSQRDVFETEDEAEKELERRKSLAILRDDAQDWVPDWGDLKQPKYSVYYRRDSERLHVETRCYTESLGDIYFETAELAEQSIKDHKEHWLRVFGVEK